MKPARRFKNRKPCPPYTCKTNGRTYKIKDYGASRVPPREGVWGRTVIGHYTCYGCGGFCVPPYHPEGEYRPKTAEELALIDEERRKTL